MARGGHDERALNSFWMWFCARCCCCCLDELEVIVAARISGLLTKCVTGCSVWGSCCSFLRSYCRAPFDVVVSREPLIVGRCRAGCTVLGVFFVLTPFPAFCGAFLIRRGVGMPSHLLLARRMIPQTLISKRAGLFRSENELRAANSRLVKGLHVMERKRLNPQNTKVRRAGRESLPHMPENTHCCV